MENSVIVPNSSSTVTSETSSDASSTQTLVGNESGETTDTLLLRFSHSCKPFKLPEYPEVAYVASQQFNDPAISVTNRQEGSENVFKFELNTEVPKYGNSLSFNIEGRTYTVDLLPYKPYRYRR